VTISSWLNFDHPTRMLTFNALVWLCHVTAHYKLADLLLLLLNISSIARHPRVTHISHWCCYTGNRPNCSCAPKCHFTSGHVWAVI